MAVESLRCKIPSTLDDLNALHEKFKWIPNSSQIRPNEKVLEHKREILHSISAYWTNFTDYILHTVFEKPRVAGIDGKWEVYDKDIEGHTRFKENQFPYSLDEGWVLCFVIQLLVLLKTFRSPLGNVVRLSYAAMQ